MYIEKLELDQLERLANMLGATLLNAEMTKEGLRITLFAGEEGVYPAFYLTDFVCIPTKFCKPLVENVNRIYVDFMMGEFDDFYENLQRELFDAGYLEDDSDSGLLC